MGWIPRMRLRERLLGKRLGQAITADRRALSGIGNLAYRIGQPELVAAGHEPSFNAHEFRCFSQNGEDGLILHLLSRVGVANHFVAEIGIEDGRECNSANLILNFGWRALLVEASADWAAKAQSHFRECGAEKRVTVLHATATPANIESLLSGPGVPREMDVLSIDIDSFDYWLWAALESIRPRIAVIEYNASFGPTRSVTIPLDAPISPRPKYYHGASLTALTRLSRRKGYVLAGCDSQGVNAFFVRDDLAAIAGIPAIAPGRAYLPHWRRTRSIPLEAQQRAIAHLPVEEVEPDPLCD